MLDRLPNNSPRLLLSTPIAYFFLLDFADVMTICFFPPSLRHLPWSPRPTLFQRAFPLRPGDAGENCLDGASAGLLADGTYA